MNLTKTRAASITAFALVAMVVTQALYFGMRSAGIDFESGNVWVIEAIGFIAIALCPMVLMAQSRAAQTAAAAIALGGIFNVVQVGFGLAMFPPLSAGGEALAGAYQAVLAGAFWLYFAGKALFGLAAMLLGWWLVRNAAGSSKILGGVAALAGLAALLVNAAALRLGMAMVLPAGATGTVATFFLALALVAVVRREAEA